MPLFYWMISFRDLPHVGVGGDLKAGQPYSASGSITLSLDNTISILPPGSSQ
jgi:hypothetical protein